MALVTVRIGSQDQIHQYDDGAFDSAFETTAPIKCGTPVDPNDALRLGDVGTSAGNVVADAVMADNTIIRGDGGARKVQDSNVTIDDAGSISLPALETVDGRDLSVDGGKLDGIEALADVTDIANINTAIGGLAGIANNDLLRWNDPGSTLEAKDIAEVIDGNNITPGDVIVNDKVRLTPLGGVAINITNKTGANSVAGQLVKADTANDDAVILTGVSEQETIGIFLDSGIADGSEAWVVVSGIADVAMEDNTASTHGNWVYASAEAGYANSTLAAPPGGGVAQIDQHMQEIGHCIESVAAGGAGTHILARCVIHFN